MLRKLAALLLVALTLAIAPATSSAHAQTYGPKLPTKTQITIQTPHNGKPIVITITVQASDGATPSGTLAYSIDRVNGGGAAAVARATSGSVHVTDGTATVTGPVAHPGTYLTSARFTPDDSSRYLGSHATNRTTVTAGSTGATNDGNGAGGLPNTGGPDLGWILAGLALLLGGAGAIVYAGRRQPKAA